MSIHSLPSLKFTENHSDKLIKLMEASGIEYIEIQRVKGIRSAKRWDEQSCFEHLDFTHWPIL